MTRRKVILPYWTPSKEDASNKEALKNKFGDLSQGELIINNSTEGSYLTILDSNDNPSTFDSSKVANAKISESFESATTFAVSAITETKVQLTDAISEAKEELTSAITETKTELTDAISSATIYTDSLIEAVYESATTFAVSAITETKTELTDAISEAKEELTSAITETKAEIPIVKGNAENSAVLKEENNQSISKGSIAIGKNNIAGLKGFYLNALTKVTDAHYVAQISDKNTELGFDEHDTQFKNPYENGDIVSIQIGSIFTNVGYIDDINGNEMSVYVENYVTFPTSDAEKRYYFYVLDKPNAGVVDLGQNAISFGHDNVSVNEASYAEGKNNKAYGKYSHVEGKENEAHYCAHAEGSNNKAIGNTSHAEGTDNVAKNSNTHVEGRYTKAIGYASHAEGYGESQDNPNLAEGNYSHVEGEKTKAKGTASHAEGMITIANGKGAHTEGRETKTTNDYTHAEGYLSVAGGIGSHAEGVGTETKNNGEHAEGRFNKSNSVAPNEGSNPKNTIHSVGIGTSDDDRKNAHEIMQDGKHYILGVGNYTGTTLDGATDVATVINNKADIPVVLLYVESANTILIKNHPAIPSSFNDFQSLQVWHVNQLLGRGLDTLFMMVDEFHCTSCIKNYEITSVPSISIIWECNNMKYQWLESGITKSPVVYADWYAVEGEPGYVENKPFYGNSYEEFFRKELDEFDSGALIGIIPYYDAMFQDEIRIQVDLEYGNMEYHDEHVLNIKKALSGEDILYESDRLVICCYNEGNDIAIKIIDNENNYISGEVRAYRPNNLKTIEERYIPDTIARKDDLSSLQLGITSEKLHLLGVVDKEAATSDTLYTSYTDVYIEDGELFALSDETYKVFGEKVEVDFEKLKTIPKVYYTWKDGSDDKPQIGTSAQKLRDIYPEAVSEVDGKLAVSYHKLSIIALAAIDELHKENEELKARLKAIEDKLGL